MQGSQGIMLGIPVAIQSGNMVSGKEKIFKVLNGKYKYLSS